jgi:hypothetical protein
MVRIEQVTSEVAMDRLVPEWRALWQRVPNATPFQSPEWLLSWWDCFGNGAPFVLTDREDGQLIAVLPLYHLDEAGCCKLLPVGISLSDYLDALVDSDHSEAAGALLGSLVDLPGWENATFQTFLWAQLCLQLNVQCSSSNNAMQARPVRSRSAQCARGVARVGSTQDIAGFAPSAPPRRCRPRGGSDPGGCDHRFGVHAGFLPVA